MRFTARRRAFAARLGLLAFVLIVLVPLAAQWRAEPADWRWLSELACHDSRDPAPLASDDGRPLPQLDACGYCSLFSHCPALAGSRDSLSGHVPAVAETAALLPLVSPSWPHFPRALSRAPPMRT